jgi:guanylate kinase
VDREQMKKLVDANEFIETAEFSGNLYGTSKRAVQDVLDGGRICILDIDMQGVKSFKLTEFQPIYVFIEAPSLEILEQRLRQRGTETDVSLQRRLECAVRELDFSKQPGMFDAVIVNDQLDRAYGELKQAIASVLPKPTARPDTEGDVNVAAGVVSA